MNFNEYIAYLFDTLVKVKQSELDNIINIILKAYNEGKMIFVIGNGGSAANASHFAQDLAKGTRKTLETEKRIRALSLTDNLAFITALSNDDGYETIFEQQLRTYAKEGDVVIAISGSGNSSNIIQSINWANKNDLTTIGITGFEGGKLKKLAQHSVNVPINDMCTAESIHSIIFHYLILELQKSV
ncbi:MAG: SIS domain-containing protein [Ignavibacteriota bacterium]|nr:SIS domain-containing protein [Ignavibacteriota bacterium]MCO6448173.1 SIS domain-containing protein [Ignavibacterium album]MCZ2267338.1 SIS domain-containing protein [Ignavibacteriales bacterium]QKJ99478.1 MAG: SIS domain-containing protein [Ignavibacteriota bacterium]HOJ06884.1 SIS domain-containing protein [Ignavibacteriaceae bacterium]